MVQGHGGCPLDSAFDVRVARNNYVEATARDTSNNNGTFFISIDVPNLDIPEGITYKCRPTTKRIRRTCYTKFRLVAHLPC